MLGPSSELSACRPLLWLFADEKQMFRFALSFSSPHTPSVFLFFVFCFMCVNSLSKAHRNLTLHFPGLTSDDTFSVTTVTLFYDAKFVSQSLPTEIKMWLWAGKQTVWKRNDLMARVFSINNFQIIQFASRMASSNCRHSASQRQPPFCFRRHSALEGPFPAEMDMPAVPFFLHLGMLKHFQNFSLKLKINMNNGF